jgi:hypothetical protein
MPTQQSFQPHKISLYERNITNKALRCRVCFRNSIHALNARANKVDETPTPPLMLFASPQTVCHYVGATLLESFPSISLAQRVPSVVAPQLVCSQRQPMFPRILLLSTWLYTVSAYCGASVQYFLSALACAIIYSYWIPNSDHRAHVLSPIDLQIQGVRQRAVRHAG